MQGYQKNIHYSKELERSILGICLLEKPPIKGVMSVMKHEYFYDPAHSAIYRCMQEMYNKNIPIDLLTVAHHILVAKKVTKIGNQEVGYFLTRLTNDVVSSAHVNYWCQVVKVMYQDRLVLAASIEGRPAPQLIKPVERKFPFKVAKYLLSTIDKLIIKQNAANYGLNHIKGKENYSIRVDSPQLVYMMSLIAPEYTWSTSVGDEYWSREKIKQQIPKECILKSYPDGSRYWENKHGYPNNW